MLEKLPIDEEKLGSIDDSLNNIQQQTFPFTGKNRLLIDLPSDISLFVDEKVISLLVTETNRYAEQKLHQHEMIGQREKSTTSKEIIKFIELMVWMSLVQKPLVRCWSTNPIYNFPLPRSRMSRNRFKLLLANLHFANNETIEQSSRLGKVLPLISILMDNY
ncbi:piggyBac transposable element-derived protein 4-like isoform X1 [Vespula squamosa]|uniref:PiggyBac transposable element-derived protein 4-like isoform X1 n=1 Tax=Vespula squamosa TaxID=30214 RepID=A0ABD2A150_VESSQ